MRPLRRSGCTMQIGYHERVFIKSFDGFSNVPLDFGLYIPPGIDQGLLRLVLE